jgi:hypothetical protein
VPDWTIRPYEPGDEADLTALFARVFGRPMSAAHWHWKLAAQRPPFPNVFLAVRRDENGRDRALSQCAAIPVRYVGPAGLTTGLVAVDAMTDPGFRRQGVLTEVHRHAYENWRQAGVPFLAGLPNQQWGSRARALGWRTLFPLTWRIRPLDVPALARRHLGSAGRALGSPLAGLWSGLRRLRQPRDPSITLRPAQSLDPFDGLWQRWSANRNPDSFTIVRDRAWFEWRYANAPDHDYRIWIAWRGDAAVGYHVSRLRVEGTRRLGYVAEFGAEQDSPAMLRLLVTHAADELAADGAELAASLARPGTAADSALRAAGFVFSWGSFSVQAVALQSRLPALSNVFGGDFDVV